MRRILRRTLSSGLRRGIRRLARKHARLLAVTLVLSLLVTSLPAAASSTPSVRLKTTAPMQGPSFAMQVYSNVTKTVTSIGSWMASFIAAERSGNSSTYQPVAAYITPAPPFIDAPTNLTVTATSSTSINLSWTAPSGTIDHYVVERSQNIQGPFFFLANVTGVTTKNDTTVTNLNAYLYRVRAVSNTGAVSPPSNMALGTAISFQFSNLAGQEIRAQHYNDVRTAINAVRPLANLAAETWDRANLLGLEVKADDVNEMRTALNDALLSLSIPLTSYEDPTLSVGANGTLIKGIHIEQLQTRSTKGSSTSSGPIDSDSSTARLDPLNATGGGGENPLSRNFNWTLSLVNLPGRAGLDLNLTLSYNSLVWTKIGNDAISFDADNGFPGPGFRLGFPVIQQHYFNSQVGKQAYLLIRPDGGRTELRQVGQTPTTSSLYEAADSSHLLFDDSTMILQTTDGTQMTYAEHGGEFKCTKIKDRNGNYISISYIDGRINTITDTLNRVITFTYENGWLTEIKQIWNQHLANPTTHYWARFEYDETTEIDFDFGNLTVIGPSDDSAIKTLSKVTMADNSHVDFSYTTWGQVSKITSYAADNSPLNYRFYDLPQTDALEHSDCPRFLARKDWARYWNGDTDGTMSTSEEVTTATFIIPESASWVQPYETEPVDGMRAQVAAADGTVDKIYFIGIAGEDTGWRRGLPALVNTFSTDPNPVRQVSRTWTQDDDTSPFPLNPRVAEINIRDLAGNRARTENVYQMFVLPNGMNCHLLRDVFEYAANGTDILRTTRTTYNMTDTYKNLRILGLVSEKQVTEGAFGTLASKVGFFYDDDGSTSIVGTDAPVQHENPTYVNGRANLSSVKRYNVNDSTSITVTRIKYNRMGGEVSTKDAADHEVTISYADSFSDGVTTHNTLAYPTSVTNPGTFISTAKYNFDFGAVTSRRTPKPNEVINKPENERPEQILTYDSLGRLEQITNSVNAASQRFVYSPAGNRVDTYTKVEAGQPEGRSWEITDGFGRVVATAKDHNTTTNTFAGQRLVYDTMGRLFRTFNPIETTASGHPSAWAAAGDDASVGWLYYVEQTYDWKGRPLVTTNQDSTTRTTSYSGCGCAGGDVVTLTDEGTMDSGTPRRRQQKIYSDVLGREKKTEVLNWENGTPYSTVVNTYNARDQLTQITQYAGPEGSLTHQDTTITFDGHGRLETKHVPEQAENTSTVWSYNADDSIQSITDARGASTSFTYNSRKLVTNISWASPSPSPSPIPVPAPVTLGYDAAGNRTSMTDGSGSVSYVYDQLSQLTSETRTLTGVSNPNSADGKFKLSYDYNVGGQLKKFTDASNMTIDYGYDVIGRLNGVTGSDTIVGGVTTYASGLQYRAAGTLKQITMGNQTTTFGYNSRLQPTSWDISGSVHQDYDYFDDGRISYVHNTTDIKFDRLYKYDHAGRLTTMYTGGDARGDFTVVPVLETFEYNQFDDVTQRENFSWSNYFFDSDSYTNHRRGSWSYDTDGRVKTIDTRNYTYDATGQATTVIGERWTINGYIPTSLDSGFDGDGNRIANTSTNGGTTTTTYFLRSSVFGANVEDLNASGQKTRGYVFTPKGTVLATQNPVGNSVMLRHLSPIGASQYEFFVSQSGSGSVSRREFDPAGALMPLADIQFGHPDRDGDLPSPFAGADTFGSIGSPAAGCTLDGVYVPCSMAYRALESGAARVCPNNDCSPRRVDIDIRYVGGATQRITGLVTDPFAIPDGFSHTWTGDAAQAAARGFNLGMANSNFGTAVVWSIIAGNAVQNVQTNDPNQAAQERARFGAAFNDMLKRLETPACAKALGGLNTVFDRIGQTTFSFGNLGRAKMVQGLGGIEPPGAQTEGNRVTINSYGAFMGENGLILDHVTKATIRLGKVMASGHPSGLKPVIGGDVALSAFILTHEVGHRTGSFVPDLLVYSSGWVSPLSVNLQMANNDKIYDACGFGK